MNQSIEPGKIYDLSIIGGGLAGLSTAITVARIGFKVILFEKEEYPFHKVCGEYMSMESWDYLTKLGLPLSTLNLPVIKNLIVTAPSGSLLTTELDMGGFGISRYKLDNFLKQIAVASNVDVMEGCKVDDVIYEKDIFRVLSSQGSFISKTCCGSFGKKSNLDTRWHRGIEKKNSKFNNYVGIKYHVIADLPDDTIALHNFKNGYCGISKIEDGKSCLCYLTTAATLNKYGNSIEKMEEHALGANPQLKGLFSSVKKITGPITISQVSFRKKPLVNNHILFTGDAAGMISPLCGNGMSMALHSGKIAGDLLSDYLGGGISRKQLENNYSTEWDKHFSARLKTGRIIQHFFGGKQMTNLFINLLKKLPGLANFIIRKTHGPVY